MRIRSFESADEDAVVELWQRCELTRPWNDPRRDIARKREVQPELFLVGELDGRLVATAMAGYEGHRGWVSYLAVDPAYQRRGLARALLDRVESCLLERGCPKLNVQIRASNAGVVAFYRELGYVEDAVVSMGKRLVRDT